MARAPVSKTGGWGFESLHSCQAAEKSADISIAVWARFLRCRVERGKVRLQRSVAADIGGSAVKAAAERVDAVERARNNLAAERSQQRHHGCVGGFNDGGALVEHENVHRNPVAHVARRRRSAADRGRRFDELPVVVREQFELAVGAWTRRVDEHDARTHRDQGWMLMPVSGKGFLGWDGPAHVTLVTAFSPVAPYFALFAWRPDPRGAEIRYRY
jgi:hypothetical protein